MKVAAFKKILEYKGTTAYECVEISLQIYEVVDKFYVGHSILGGEHFFYKKLKGREYTIIDEEYNFGYRFRRKLIAKDKMVIPLKINNKTRMIKGIILYESKKSMIKFLKKYIDFSKNCYFNELIKECKGINGKPNLELFFERIEEYRYFEWRDTFIEIEKKDRTEMYNYYFENNNTYIMNKSGLENTQRIFAIETKREIDGYNVPEINYIYQGIKDKKEYIVTYFNGQIKIYENFYNINPVILKNIDQSGKIYNTSYVDLLPDNSREVFAILRIPTKKEYAKYKSKSKSKKTNNDNYQILNKIFYVSPSLKACNIKPGVRVIDDIDIFRQIISKISSDIYIPGNMSIEFNEELLPDDEQFLLLEKPV